MNTEKLVSSNQNVTSSPDSKSILERTLETQNDQSTRQPWLVACFVFVFVSVIVGVVVVGGFVVVVVVVVVVVGVLAGGLLFFVFVFVHLVFCSHVCLLCFRHTFFFLPWLSFLIGVVSDLRSSMMIYRLQLALVANSKFAKLKSSCHFRVVKMVKNRGGGVKIIFIDSTKF